MKTEGRVEAQKGRIEAMRGGVWKGIGVGKAEERLMIRKPRE
jgi:hypothetical protein